MRILFVVHQFMPEFAAGTERVTLNLAKSAQRDGHRVEIVTCSLRESSLWHDVDEDGIRFAVVEGIPVHGLPGHQMEILAQLGVNHDESMGTMFARFLDGRGPYDLVHVTHPMRMVDAVETISSRNIPYIVTLTDFFFLCYKINLTRFWGDSCPGPASGETCKVHCPLTTVDPAKLNARQLRMSAILLAAFDVVACSTFVAARFERELKHLRIRVVEHGVDLLRFARPSNGNRDAVVFGYIGTKSVAKGVLVLAEAFAAAGPANARLELIGPTHGNQEVNQHLQALAEIDDRIHIRSAIAADQVPASLAQFDVLCLPSLVPETFSLTLQEGFAAGLGCLVSDLGYPAEIVRRNRCGEVLPPGEVRTWTDAIERIALDVTILDTWRRNIPLPTRVEEEGFLYSCLYRAAVSACNDR